MRNPMKTILTILIFLKLGLVRAQPVNLFAFPLINNQGQTISSFVPERWAILDSTSGDLNGDHKTDIALVIQSKDSLITFTHLEQQGEEFVEINKSEKYLRRLLLILHKDPLTDIYNLAEQSNTIILSNDDRTMEDPFEDIKIDNGILKISYVAKSKDVDNGITSTYSFLYQNEQYRLVEVERNIWSEFPPMLENSKFDLVNQTWSVTKGDPNRGQKPKTIWKDLNNLEIQTIKTFMRPYTWHVTENIFL